MNCLLCSTTEDLILKNNIFSHCIRCDFCEYYKVLGDAETEPYSYLCIWCNNYWSSLSNAPGEEAEKLREFWDTVNENHFSQNHSSIEIV